MSFWHFMAGGLDIIRSMKSETLLPLLGCFVMLAAASTGFAKTVKVELKDSQGKNIGTAKISPAGNGVEVDANLHERRKFGCRTMTSI